MIGGLIMWGLMIFAAGFGAGALAVVTSYRRRWRELADWSADLERQGSRVQPPKVDPPTPPPAALEPTPLPLPVPVIPGRPLLELVDEVQPAPVVPAAALMAELDQAQERRRKSQAAAAVIAHLRAERGEGALAAVTTPEGRHAPGWVPGTTAQVARCERAADDILADVSMTDEIKGLSGWLAATGQHMTFREISA